MASVSMGRIIYTRQALPAVELVNFALDHGDIVIKTDGDSRLAAATRHTIVAFEADCLDAQQAGWSVTAIGPSREVTDPDDIGRLRTIDLSSLAHGTREHFVRVSPELLNGRRLRGLASMRGRAERNGGTFKLITPGQWRHPADLDRPPPPGLAVSRPMPGG